MSTIERETSTVLPSVLDPRVERGAGYLDEVVPGWADHMDLDVFDLASCQCCVLGQIGWGYIPPDGPGLGGAQAGWNTHGFHVEDPDHERRTTTYRALEQDWRLAILSRRTA